MKTLYLLRHAKSSSDNPDLADFDRPLNERGYTEAHLVSKALHEKKIVPEILISSPAIRALSTALIFAVNLKFPVDEIQIRRKLYDSSVHDYLKCIAEVESGTSLLLAGHNETITETAQKLSGQRIIEMKTSCIVALEFDADSWKDVVHLKGKLVFNIGPEAIKNR